MDKKKFNLQTFLEQKGIRIPKSVKADIAYSTDQEIEGGIDLGLYLPFHPLIREILSKLGLAPIQLSLNCWRIMFGIIALNQICKINLGWNEFCHCYVVKQNCAGTYYFSHRETTTVLVTDLPKSEKGWKDNLISLTGDWERRPGDTDTHLVPRTKATTALKSTGLKPRDSDVNHLDLNKALGLPNQERNWKQLRDHLHPESKIADESQTSLLTATCPPRNSLGSYAQSMEADLSEMMTDILSSPSSYKKQKRIHPHSATPIVANLVLTNPCSDYESIPSVAAVKSKGTVDNIDLQGLKDQETADLSKKDIKIDQLLKHKSHEEVRPQVAQTFGKVYIYIYTVTI
ncbi:hypothetical protein FEM48_ZijujUnG0079000 [Ziziphus jujuba var. spinosa]|uniref:Uncharacterized protein n=1 Tax=Ziziphus jujuba var. spinosa TaxID=714518 RepID=A0A978U8P9_ZIZJJ|nr:hypothetical protein FEM48_ZijujUnG0079000 [Ziziphus jujuba var. spinosa]